jgi:hypothetical protein
MLANFLAVYKTIVYYDPERENSLFDWPMRSPNGIFGAIILLHMLGKTS